MNNTYFIKSKQSNFDTYYWYKEELKSYEIDKIKLDIQSIPSQKAEIDGGNNDTIRLSTIKWIPRNQQWEWLYDRMTQLITIANNEMWNFDITNIIDQIQYTEYYDTEKGHYDWHIDVGSGELSHRKLSIAIQISDPSEYEGGLFQIWLGGNSVQTCEKSLGTAVVFPSFYMHRVTPVTKGVRKSLVLWVGGTPYK